MILLMTYTDIQDERPGATSSLRHEKDRAVTWLKISGKWLM